MFSRAVGREQISLDCVGSARSDSATLGLPPAHGVCAFPVYTAQTLGCSAGTCLMWALVCMHFRGISRAGSGSRVLTKVQTWLGLCFAPVPCLSSSSDQVLGVRSCPQLKAATYPLPRPSFSVFWVYNGHGFSGVPCVSSGELISGCDPPGGCPSSRMPRSLG